LRHCDSPDCPAAETAWTRWLQPWQWIELSGTRYCVSPCAVLAVASQIERRVAVRESGLHAEHRIPLGLLLVSRGWITQDDLQRALRRQRDEPGLRLGNILVNLGSLTENNLTLALSLQWGCPAFALSNRQAVTKASTLLPRALQLRARAVPVYASPERRILHLASRDRIDHSLLYALGEMLEWRVHPCVADDSILDEALHSLEMQTSAEELVCDTVSDPFEMAEVVILHASRLKADMVSVTSASDTIWIRLNSSNRHFDLLFPAPCRTGKPQWQSMR
jgi:hypothetical protein